MNRFALLALAGLAVAAPALAHHSFAMFDQRKVMTLNGTVHEFQWTNPHAWIELNVSAGGKTPMCGALTLARQVVAEFVERHPDCYPPMVVNITDGAATDGNPETAADEVRKVASTDGNTLLFNVHLSSKALKPIEYPDTKAFLPDDYARMLYRMSSVLPPKVQASARSEGFLIGDASRGFVFNADLVAVIHFMDIGTKVGQVA